MPDEILLVPPVSVGRQYLVKGKTGYLLIDTGLRNSYTNLAKFLKSSRISLSEIELVVITHADGDHFGGLEPLLRDSPKTVSAATQIEAESIQKGVSSRPLHAKGIQWVFYNLVGPLFAAKPAQIKRILTPGEKLPYLGGLEVLDTRGHTPGHISLWSESTRTLFAGDSINIHGNLLSPSTGANTWDADLAKNSFELQMNLHPDQIFAGHGVWNR